jgi:hypothetical protein
MTRGERYERLQSLKIGVSLPFLGWHPLLAQGVSIAGTPFFCMARGLHAPCVTSRSPN